MSARSLLCACTTLCCALTHAQWVDGVALERDGARLTYDGKPFAAVGVNKHELLDQYMAALMGKSDQEAAEIRAAGELSLKRLQDNGITVARVRASAFWPAQIERTYLHEDVAVREAFWAALDAMLDDCDRYGIRVVPTIAWHLGGWADLAHESLADLYTDPQSESRRLLLKWTEELVTRYRDRDTVLFWELTNEANLGADLRAQHPDDGILGPKLERPAPHIVRGPVIRDGRNNYSSDELAALTREWVRFIKQLDPSHLVGTGFSAPRPAAWHLWMGSIRRSGTMDWTVDTPEQAADYLRMINPAPVDIISLHTYNPDLSQMLCLKLAADSIDKPVYIGELGMSERSFPDGVYNHPNAIEGLRLSLQGFREMGVQLCLPWTWDEWGKPIHEPVLRPASQPKVVEALRRANEEAIQRAGMEPDPAEALKVRMAELTTQLQGLLPPN